MPVIADHVVEAIGGPRQGAPEHHDLADADASADKVQGIAVAEHDGDADKRKRNAEDLVARERLAQEQRRRKQRDGGIERHDERGARRGQARERKHEAQVEYEDASGTEQDHADPLRRRRTA